MNRYLILLACGMLTLTACGGSSDSSGNDTQSDNVSSDSEGVNNGGQSSNEGTDNNNDANLNTNTQAWLSAHNQYRRQHQVADVKWSDNVAKSAEAFVKTCPTDHSGSPYGENIAFATYKQSVDDVVRRWYEEINLYNYATPENVSGVGHFTQIIWKKTTHIGCAQASNCSGKWKDIVVCQYNPPGNYVGQFADNVLPKQ